MPRWLPWLLPATAAAVVAPLARGDGGDGWIFVAAGRTLLSRDWGHAFADSGIQVGPLQLALFGSVGRSPVALAVVLAVAVAVLVVMAARAVGVEKPAILVGAGLASVATGMTSAAYDAGHPANAIVPLLWIIAAAGARRGRAGLAVAGVLIGLTAGLETWGILGIAVLTRARAVALSVVTAGALFLPFVLAGHFAMGSYRWEVSQLSPLVSHVMQPGATVGWGLRIAQGALALAAGSAVAHRLRGSAHALWLVPAVVVLTRLLLDPLGSYYYYVGLEGPALVGLALLAARGLPHRLSREATA